MARTAKRLVDGSQLTTSAATYYTAPASTTTVIHTIALTNFTGGAVTATVHLVPSGGSASNSNMIMSAQSIAAGATTLVTGATNQVLAAAGTIQALASAGTSISIVASGVEIV